MEKLTVTTTVTKTYSVKLYIVSIRPLNNYTDEYLKVICLRDMEYQAKNKFQEITNRYTKLPYARWNEIKLKMNSKEFEFSKDDDHAMMSGYIVTSYDVVQEK